MLVFDRDNWPYHRSWCLAIVLATAAGAIWYVIYGFSSGSWHWPGGGSPPGFAYGALGGAIILFEMLLWPRKSLWRGWRLGRTKWWMTGHIWLGLLALPLLLLHGGFHFNPATSTLAAVLMWLLVVVVGSGIFGLVVQNIVPRLMLERLPAETITSQIDRVLAQYRDDAEWLVRATCGDPPADGLGEAAREAPGFVAIGTVRQVGRVQGKVVQAAFEAGYVPESEPLLAFYRELVEPYLRRSPGRGFRWDRRGGPHRCSRPSRIACARRPIPSSIDWPTSATSAASSTSRPVYTVGCSPGSASMSPCRSRCWY